MRNRLWTCFLRYVMSVHTYPDRSTQAFVAAFTRSDGCPAPYVVVNSIPVPYGVYKLPLKLQTHTRQVRVLATPTTWV